MNANIQHFIESISIADITSERKQILEKLVLYIREKKENNKVINLNFICTHNSRRSQFSQVWAKVMADFYNVDINSFSGGVEVTACNERTIASLLRTGFEVKSSHEINPKYHLTWKNDGKGIILFSKLFDDRINPQENFAAIMTCAHADENCPFVTGCDERIPIRYEDPKAFDDTDREEQMYDARSREIATEMKYVFSEVK